MEQLYKCIFCGWIGTEDEMQECSDCGDPEDAVWIGYCCPNCGEFYATVDDYEKVDEEYDNA